MTYVLVDAICKRCEFRERGIVLCAKEKVNGFTVKFVAGAYLFSEPFKDAVVKLR